MTRRITIEMLVKAIGKNEIDAIENKIRRAGLAMTDYNRIMTHGQILNEKQTNSIRKQNAALTGRLNAGKQSIRDLAAEQVLNERLNQSWERRLNIERHVVILMRERKGLTEEQYYALAKQEIQEERLNQKRREANAILRMNRREILASTMAIFGMTMSIWQVTNALSAMAGENEEMREEMMRLQAMMMGATGPLLLIHGIVQMMNMGVTRLALSMRAAVPAAMALSMAYLAMTTPSEKLRAIYSVMTGIMVALAATQMMVAATHWAAAKAAATQAATEATLQGIVTAGASLSWTMASVAVGIGVGATLLTFIAATMASAQTELGQMRRIEATGLLFAHKGETIGRVSEPVESGTRGGEPQLIILQVDGEELGRVWANVAETEDFVG